MAAALYDPEGGFFTSKSLRSVKGGDFLTSPEVSPLFGETLAKFVDEELSTLPDSPLPPAGGGRKNSDPRCPSRGGGPAQGPEARGWQGSPPERSEWRGSAGRSSRGCGLLPLAGEGWGEGGTPLLVEVGAGSGSLLKPLLATLETAVEPWAVEASPAAREALEGLVAPDHIVPTLDELPDHFFGVVFANELLDNLPVALAVRTGQRLDRTLGRSPGR